jgi:YD repeat-containing protein
MKTLLLMIAAATFATSSFSQSQSRPDFFAEALQRQSARTTALISLKDSSYWHSAWAKASGTWDYTRRNIYHYNSFYKEDGNLSANDDGSGWKNEENAKNYLYDSNHRLLEVTLEGWTGSWNDQYKMSYTYDAAGNMLTKTDLVWVSGTWQNRYRASNTYSGNNLSVALYQYWDNSTNSWTNNTRSTFTYTGNLLASATDEDWNATSWLNSSARSNFIYAGSDLLSYDFGIWNPGMGAFELKTKTSYSYDTNHHMMACHLELWNAPTTTWEKYLKTEYTYDSLWNQTRILEQNWDASLSDWTNSSLILNYYRTGTVGVNEGSAENNAFAMHPNPATDRITVSIFGAGPSGLSITDVSGKTVMTLEADQAGPFSVNIESLEAGLYFMELRNEQGAVTRKFIKN